MPHTIKTTPKIRRHARTVDARVDREVAPLVDALNESPLRVHTSFSCSGHTARRAWPYVSFEGADTGWVDFVVDCVSSVNEVTLGQTRLELPNSRGGAVIRLSVYGRIRPEVNSWPLTAGLANPPRRLVQLWWLELAELARMVRKQDPRLSGKFMRAFDRLIVAASRPPWWHTIFPIQDEPDPHALPRLIQEVVRRRARRT